MTMLRGLTEFSLGDGQNLKEGYRRAQSVQTTLLAGIAKSDLAKIA